MRGGKFDYKKFISEIKLLDTEIIDLSPSISEKFEKKKRLKKNTKKTNKKP